MNNVAAVPKEQLTQAIIHPSADLSPRAVVGAGTRIWHNVQIREDVTIGSHCIVGKDVYIDSGVTIGNNVKIQNNALLYQGVTLADGVFIGPRVCFTNDLYPRAIRVDGTLKDAHDWTLVPTKVEYGASIGAGAVIVAGVTIGRFAMVAAGAVVTHSVPPFALVMGLPARVKGYVCRCGRPLQMEDGLGWCTYCQEYLEVGEATS